MCLLFPGKFYYYKIINVINTSIKRTLQITKTTIKKPEQEQPKIKNKKLKKKIKLILQSPQ